MPRGYTAPEAGNCRPNGVAGLSSRTHYADRLADAVQRKGTAAVVGLDPVLENLPEPPVADDLGRIDAASAVERFCDEVLDLVAPHVPAVKINSAFFEALYGEGFAALHRVIERAHDRGLLVIGDLKRGDIGSTARLYAQGYLADPPLGWKTARTPQALPDAITIAGYMGATGVRPFVEAAAAGGRGLYVLVRPSEPSADLIHESGSPTRLYEQLARLVHEWGGANSLRGACGLSCVGAVVAPKDPESTGALRAMLPHTPFLVPGYGAQGATADACRACFLPDGGGAVVNASRSVICAHQRADLRQRFGGDWRACVAEACRLFAADIAPLCRPR